MTPGRFASARPPARERPRSAERDGNRLGALLCWAVVFADIGTSVYYVPGILYAQVGLLAGLFVSMTLVAFALLALKYAEVSVRFPQGGGVVTVAAHGINPWVGAIGGMFILVDYFLTSAISSDSGVQYLSAIVHQIAPYIVPLTLVLLVLLGLLNWWGIRESAQVSAAFAVAAFVTDMMILAAVGINVPWHAITQVFAELFAPSLRPVTLLVGFAGSFLAFSGLESIAQLAPVMRTPRRRTVTVALVLVVATVGLTSPLLTIFSTTLLTTCTPHFTHCAPEVLRATLAHHAAQPDPNQFISELAALAGGSGFGRVLEVLTAITAATLLVFASNTAIIGAYHVFLALARMRFFPGIVAVRNRWRGTPHVAILLATAIPMVVLVGVRGDVNTLGDMYAFGLLGAFTLTCLGLDVIRWRERGGAVTLRGLEEHENHAGGRTRWRGWQAVTFALGLLTTLLVSVAWVTNLGAKPLATAFGGGVTVLGVGIAVAYYAWQHSHGRRPVFTSVLFRAIPGAVLVVLAPDEAHAEQVVRVACERAAGHSVVMLYLGDPVERPIRPMQFGDPYLYDEAAQHVFSKAAHLCHRLRARSTYFVYSLGGTDAALRAWQIIQPAAVVVEEAVAGARLAAVVAPEPESSVELDGARVVVYARLREAEAAGAEAAGAEAGHSSVE
jgi:amino acid transporter